MRQLLLILAFSALRSVIGSDNDLSSTSTSVKKSSKKQLTRRNTPEIKFNRLVFNDSIENMNRPVRRRRQQRRQSPLSIPTPPPKQSRRCFLSLLTCFSRASTADALAPTQPSPPIDALKEAINNDDRAGMYRLLDQIPFEDLYLTRLKALNNQPFIHYALSRTKFVAFRVLLERILPFFTPTQQAAFFSDLLVRAVTVGNLQFVRYLIETRGIRIEPEQFLFHLAVSHRVPSDLLRFLFRVIDQSYFDIPYGKFQESVWHTVIRFQNLDAFVFLYEQKFRPAQRSQVNLQNVSPIEMLVKPKRLAFLGSLCERIPDLLNGWSDVGRNTLIHVAAATNSVEALEYLISKAPQMIGSGNGFNQSPLCQAITFQALEAARLLLRRGSNVFAVDSRGWDILQICLAVGGKSYELLPEILQRFDNRQDIYRLVSTVQFLLGNYQWKEAEAVLAHFPSLLSYQYNFLLQDTSLFAATLITWNLPVLFEICLQKSVFLANAVIEGEGKALLHVAAQAGNPLFVSRLLEAGANPAVLDKSSQTAFEVARESDNRSAIGAFLARGQFKINGNCKLSNFRAAILFGGSFVSYRGNRLDIASFPSALHLFKRLFAGIIKVQKLTIWELVLINMQFELFLAYHLTPQIVQHPQVIKKIEAIFEDRKALADRYPEQLELRFFLLSLSPSVRMKLQDKLASPPLKSSNPLKIEKLIVKTEIFEHLEQVALDYTSLFNE